MQIFQISKYLQKSVQLPNSCFQEEVSKQMLKENCRHWVKHIKGLLENNLRISQRIKETVCGSHEN